MKRPQYIDQVLTDEQLELLKKWTEVNNLDESTIEFYDDCKFGVRIFMESEDNGESWEIDFTTDEEFERAVDAMDDAHEYGKEEE